MKLLIRTALVTLMATSAFAMDDSMTRADSNSTAPAMEATDGAMTPKHDGAMMMKKDTKPHDAMMKKEPNHMNHDNHAMQKKDGAM